MRLSQFSLFNSSVVVLPQSEEETPIVAGVGDRLPAEPAYVRDPGKICLGAGFRLPTSK